MSEFRASEFHDWVRLSINSAGIRVDVSHIGDFMTRWSRHNICRKCWEFRNPDRKPLVVRFDPMPVDICCYCADETEDGIYVRSNQFETNCGEDHDDD